MTINVDHKNNTLSVDSGNLILANPLNYATTQTIASAATVDIGAATSNSIIISGTTTITSLGTATAGAERVIQFSGSLTLTHNATSLILPGAVNITTAAGDVAYFISLGSGNWRCSGYQRANGQSVISGGATGGGNDKIFWKNDQVITTNYTILGTENAGTFGPVTVANGVTITVNDGGRWTVVQ